MSIEGMTEAVGDMVISCEIDPHELEYDKKIGKGVFGTVYLGKCRGKLVAIKKLKRQQLEEETLADFRKEVSIMSQIRHPNVLLFMGACTQPGQMCIVTEFIDNDSLDRLLHNHKMPFSLFARLKMARDAALGINWLHGMNPQIIHRDIKPPNLLIDQHYNVKVCDFGLSALKPRGEKLENTEGAGSPIWMSPEGLRGQPVDEKSDVYSYGIVLWEIFTRQPPFPEFTSFKAFKKAICDENVRPPVPDSCPRGLAELMTACWDPEATRRPNFKEILVRLDSLLVDVAVKDETARRLWKHYFLGKDTVKWSKFVQALCQCLKIEEPAEDDQRFRCVQALLAKKHQDPKKTKQQDVVDLEAFGKFMGWFGPLVGGENILDKVLHLCAQPWFHGDLSKNDTVVALAGKKKGTFLVRLSTFDDGVYTISKVTPEKRISHQRCHYSAEARQYSIVVKDEVRKYNSLTELVSKCKDSLGIRKPCEGSRLSVLFMNIDDAYMQPGGM